MTYIFFIIALIGTVAGQLLLKKGLQNTGGFQGGFSQLFPFLIKALTNPLVLLSIFLVAVASVSWIFAVSKAQLSFIYPLMGLSYVIVAFFSAAVLKENVPALSWVGISLISLGVILFLAKSH